MSPVKFSICQYSSEKLVQPVSFIKTVPPGVKYTKMIKTYTVLHLTLLYCTAFYFTVLYCTLLYFSVQYCSVRYCTVLYCPICPSKKIISMTQAVSYSSIIWPSRFSTLIRKQFEKRSTRAKWVADQTTNNQRFLFRSQTICSKPRTRASGWTWSPSTSRGAGTTAYQVDRYRERASRYIDRDIHICR